MIFDEKKSASDAWRGCVLAVGVQVCDFAFSLSACLSVCLSMRLLTHPLSQTVFSVQSFCSVMVSSMNDSASDAWRGCVVALGVQVCDFAFSSSACPSVHAATDPPTLSECLFYSMFLLSHGLQHE
jgi:hypothetical protein